MLNRIIKISFSILGAITGFTILHTILSMNIKIGENLKVPLVILFSSVFCAIFYFMAAKIIEVLTGFIDKIEKGIQNVTMSELVLGAAGLILGLIVANLVSIPIIKIQIIGLPFAVIINILFGLMGVILSQRKKNESIADIFKEQSSARNKKLVDTCTIIDGRIFDIFNAGFLEGDIIIPAYVLEELRHIADSPDGLRRARGRRGLDILNLLQKEGNNIVRIDETDFPDIQEVDEKLLKTAQKLKCKLVTIDYNLTKVAALKGIQVLNINDLANAVKPVALPGEEMNILVVKDGKENGQGVGFLEDGTMIVVDGGKKYLNQTIPVMVTSVLQTSAGRMVFAKPSISD
ncbi:PIN/TRAM domain-containing protein [Ruminiclostridium papyrosolvens]|uniref:Twitching motility protein PilT n=1 Tax=Ruminiclostridium papyrosolvens C7 TaxID=1330534 RepID=U4R573_9FIRM|nr:PIN domain-containing protein [Ruminiclostridium papyrosolvens]EPR13689.1 twitching motility protein PilT [Ruminiclostridium papyrosolvens C7]